MSVNMTKDVYYEMCEALGSEPIEEEIPIEMEDFPIEAQEAINVYFRLKDDWDTMNGVYMGKSYMGLIDIMNIMEIPKEDRKYLLEWIGIMDTARSKAIKAAKPANKSEKAS